MKVTRYQLDFAVYGMRQAIELCEYVGLRVRREMREVVQQLDDLLMFADEPDSDDEPGQLKPEDLMGPKAVAAELGWTPQHVGRKAKDIGGVLVEGHWVFYRQDVDDWKAWKDYG